jgi:DNA-binding CsgD family transcriptional regulator
MNGCFLSSNLDPIKQDVIDVTRYAEKVSNIIDINPEFINKKKNTHDKEALIGLGMDYPDIFLTEREAHCALLLMLGFTSKEIGKRISLSSRTVEHYLLKAKEKLAIQSRSKFIEILLKSDFIKNISLLIDS